MTDFFPPPPDSAHTYPAELLRHPLAQKTRFLPLRTLDLGAGYRWHAQHHFSLNAPFPSSLASSDYAPPLRRCLRLWWHHLPLHLSAQKVSSLTAELHIYGSPTTAKVAISCRDCEMKGDSSEVLSTRRQLSILRSFVSHLKKTVEDLPLVRLELSHQQDVRVVYGGTAFRSTLLGVERCYPPWQQFVAFPTYSTWLHQRMAALAGGGHRKSCSVFEHPEGTLSLLLAQAGYQIEVHSSSAPMLAHHAQLIRQHHPQCLGGAYVLPKLTPRSSVLWAFPALDRQHTEPCSLLIQWLKNEKSSRPQILLLALRCNLSDEDSWLPMLKQWHHAPYLLRQVEGLQHPPLEDSSTSPYTSTLLLAYSLDPSII